MDEDDGVWARWGCAAVVIGSVVLWMLLIAAGIWLWRH